MLNLAKRNIYILSSIIFLSLLLSCEHKPSQRELEIKLTKEKEVLRIMRENRKSPFHNLCSGDKSQDECDKRNDEKNRTEDKVEKIYEEEIADLERQIKEIKQQNSNVKKDNSKD